MDLSGGDALKESSGTHFFVFTNHTPHLALVNFARAMSQSLSFSRRTLPCKNEAYASASSRPYRIERRETLPHEPHLNIQ